MPSERLAGRRQLAADREVSGPVEGDLAAAQKQLECDRQVGAVGVIVNVGWSGPCRHMGASVHCVSDASGCYPAF